jgi:cytochrome c-L
MEKVHLVRDWCSGHLWGVGWDKAPDGRWLGPSLIGDDWKYKRVATDVGMFEVIYAGAAGAMQSFSGRGVTQDETLKIIACVRTLKK